MKKRSDSFYDPYSRFADPTQRAIRKETFGTDIGQNSWITADEYDRLIVGLNLAAADHVLEVASGSGGPALYVAGSCGCRITGLDANENGVANANELARQAGASSRVGFSVADATAPLPFDAEQFDAIVCIDSMNHFPDRPAILKEWHRVLRKGRRALFTDPVVITGAVTNHELALRSSIGTFLFVPSGVNEQLIEKAGFRLLRQEDVTANAALIAGRWHRARRAHKQELLNIESEKRFEEIQRFFGAVRDLSRPDKLSRVAYLVEKPTD